MPTNLALLAGDPQGSLFSFMQREKYYEKPIEYVKGFTDFLGCKIDLSKKPLIPRPETEFWVSKAIQDTLTYSSLSVCYNCGVIKILDLFAGSGCIGIVILKHMNLPAGRVQVIFADNDKKCLEQIKINLKINNGLIRTNKPIVVESDVFSNIKGKFDFIFANPPYVAEKLKHKVQKSVLNYEPCEALFAGEDGLFYIKKFLTKAKNYLNPRGKIFMEFSPEQKGEIEKILKNFKYSNFKFHKDQFNRWRWLVVEF